ncbi:MAG: hypothetical protein B7C24_03025 [Bacteroidetes bacterium 4572_77]|nr:MAG: hypothetical protein B7C24_03025 [Bacteroidetes bacterium 4572_77]
MKDTSTLISGIYYKIKLLVDRNAQLTKEIVGLEHQNSLLIKDLDSINKELSSSKKELDVIKITKTISLGDEKDHTKEVINKLVRDIDKSLNLLNK